MRRLKIVLAGCLAVILSACGQAKDNANLIRVGTISGPETQLMQVAQNVALEKYGLTVKIVEFSDYNLPNQALDEGSIDANLFQHLPYLAASVNAHHYDIVPVARTFIYPMAIYSSKLDRLSDIGEKGIVAIPDDPTNEGRALFLLQKAGLIKLKSNVSIVATVDDIAKNPLHLRFKELDAAELPRALSDVDLAVINSNYAIAAGLSPHLGDLTVRTDALFVEGRDSMYANLLVVRREDKDSPKVKMLIASFQSPQVLAAAQTIFHGDEIKAW